jgi:tripartite-type tricarboxylate transporter receptor subunit TctC
MAFPCSRLLQGIGLLLAATSISSVHAQATNYPNKPVRVMVPFAPGGSNDIIGRFIADELGKKLGQPFVVENRGGAGGLIGTDAIAKSAPDGYNILLISTPHTANSYLYKNVPYDAIKDFAPIARIGTTSAVISVTSGLPVKTLPELIAYAKARPGQLNYVSSGIGSSQHLISEMFAMRAGIKLTHIPYKGAGAALADVAAGHAQISIGTPTQAMPFLRGGRMRALAVSGPKRQPLLPDVPTTDEVGLKNYDADNWWGLLAPAGTPPAVIAKLSKAVEDIMAMPETKKRFEEDSATVAYMPSEEFGKFMAQETVKWGDIIKTLNIQPE